MRSIKQQNKRLHECENNPMDYSCNQNDDGASLTLDSYHQIDEYDSNGNCDHSVKDRHKHPDAFEKTSFTICCSRKNGVSVKGEITYDVFEMSKVTEVIIPWLHANSITLSRWDSKVLSLSCQGGQYTYDNRSDSGGWYYKKGGFFINSRGDEKDDFYSESMVFLKIRKNNVKLYSDFFSDTEMLKSYKSAMYFFYEWYWS